PNPLDLRRTGMTSIAENTASCALCRRHLLVGEPARLYQDPASKRFLKVCPLCYEQADRRGWRADGRPIVAVQANPPRDAAQREQELEHERGRYADLAEARRTEGDARQIRRMALEAFNRSSHVDRVVAISRSLGDPVVNVAVEGCELPRVVSICVAWDISWY